MSGRVPSEGSSDVQLGACTGEFALGATGCFNVMMQKFYFVFAAASLHKVDSVMLWVQKMIHGKIKDSLFHFHPAPRLIKEC